MAFATRPKYRDMKHTIVICTYPFQNDQWFREICGALEQEVKQLAKINRVCPQSLSQGRANLIKIRDTKNRPSFRLFKEIFWHLRPKFESLYICALIGIWCAFIFFFLFFSLLVSTAASHSYFHLWLALVRHTCQAATSTPGWFYWVRKSFWPRVGTLLCLSLYSNSIVWTLSPDMPWSDSMYVTANHSGLQKTTN